MNDFKKSIQVSNTTMESIESVMQVYMKHNRKMEFKDKISLAVYNAINDVHTENSDEEKMKIEYLHTVNVFLGNYETLLPVVEATLNKRKFSANLYH